MSRYSMPEELKEMLRIAELVLVTEAEQDLLQRRFAYGNARASNPNVTPEMFGLSEETP